jgi:hypothetical protein
MCELEEAGTSGFGVNHSFDEVRNNKTRKRVRRE